MKRALLLILTLFVSVAAIGRSLPTMFAHRGCWSKNALGEFIIPENSVAAVAMAARMGYAGIECDVRLTKDKKMVILHDKTINRTLRRASDYSKIEEKIYLKDLTFEQLCNDYVMESEDPQLRVPLPTLEQILAECKKHGLIPMLHSSVADSYRVAQEMFGDNWICFTDDFDKLLSVREYSDCLILYAINGGTVEQLIAKLKQLGGHCGVSTMNSRLYTPQFCKALTRAGYEVQASIFKSPKEVVAQRNGVTYQLSDFSIMPTDKPYDKVKFRGAGDYKWVETKQCGATVVDILYSGTVKVIINGTRTYILTRETVGSDIIGNRFFNIAPQLEIIPQQGAVIKRSKVKVYQY